MQKLVFPMRETMPYFVCSLRQVDEWKRFQAKQSHVFTQAEYDVNAKYIKSPFAKSLNLEDLQRFLDDTELDINFMVQLPSIEKCLDQWWKLYTKEAPHVDQEQLRQVYYDLANVLVQAKTENIHKNSVSMIMRASWTKWAPKDPPLDHREFNRLLFILAHLMTESNRLGEYVTFFQETLAKITRVYQSKAKRTELWKRKPKVRRKSSVVEILSRSGSARRRIVSSSAVLTTEADTTRVPGADGTPGQAVRMGESTVSVTLQRVISTASIDDDPACADRFVEVVDRRGLNSRYGTAQHVLVDPLLLDRRFQDKWKVTAKAQRMSSEDALREMNPQLNRYMPLMSIARLQPTGPGVKGLLNNNSRQCQSTPAFELKEIGRDIHALRDGREEREEEVLRRSLSMVTLKKRIQSNKRRAHGSQPLSEAKSEQLPDHPEPIHLAIST